MANNFLLSAEGIQEPEWMGRAEPFLQKIARELSIDGEEVSVLFCGDDFIRELNKSYRNIDSATDVLSFENGERFADSSGAQWLLAGDIAVSLDSLKKNAEIFGVDEDGELKRLLLHGFLHLNGYDHGDEHIEKGKIPECEMLKIQEEILLKYKGEKII